MTTIRVSIVDDEPLARRRLKDLLADHHDMRLVGEAGDGNAALAMIRQAPADLLFLDMQMPERHGLEVASALQVNLAPLIVFVTAFDQFAAQAFELDAVDYLLKPFDDLRFAAMLDRVRRRLGVSTGTAKATLEHVVAISAGRIRLVPVDEIERAEAAGNYVNLVTARGNHLVRQSLASLATDLPQGRFLRVHRSALIRVDCIREIRATSHGDAQLELANGDIVAVSRRFRRQLEWHFHGI